MNLYLSKDTVTGFILFFWGRKGTLSCHGSGSSLAFTVGLLTDVFLKYAKWKSLQEPWAYNI